jgi:hypothetical protein
VDPRAGLDDVEKRKFLTLPGLELGALRLPAPSQSEGENKYENNINMDLRESGFVIQAVLN